MPHAHLYRGWGTGLYARLSASVVGPYHRQLAGRLASELTPGAALLDVGCGPGAFLVALAASRRDLALTGLDPAAAAVRHARGLAPSAVFTRATAEALPFAAGAFAVVTAIGSVKYWRDRARGFAEVHRVLATGGRLLLSELDPKGGGRLDAVASAYPRITAGVLRRFVLPGSLARSTVRSAAIAAGFAVVGETDVPGLPFYEFDLVRG